MTNLLQKPLRKQPAAAAEEALLLKKRVLPRKLPHPKQPPKRKWWNLHGPRPADTVAFPDPPELDLGGVIVEPLPIDQIVTYKALDSYSEPEWVTALVEAGELPPVEERLPVEPKVVLSGGLSDGGVYGGAWRDFSACPTAGWNNGAGVTSGWFGIEAMSFNYQALVKTGPLFRADQDVEPFPNLAKSWEWSEDGLQLTMNLIEGARRSDGEPPSPHDVIFYVGRSDQRSQHRKSNESRVMRSSWTACCPRSKPWDDYTILWTFAQPFPRQLSFYYMDEGDLPAVSC
ncbi:MAG: ABC transporter substrate-binding protein [Caldilineaceae bacterium]